MTDAVGTTLFGYAPGGLLASEDGPWSSDTVSLTYANRLRTGLTLLQPTSTWTNRFTWDAAVRLASVVSPAGTFTYNYNVGQSVSPVSLVQSLSLPGGNYITNIYDPLARLAGTWLKKSDNTILDSATYGYNAGNQRTWFTNAAGTYVGFAYDNIGQLKVADSSVNTEDRGYAYDASWNLKNRTNNGVNTTFSVDNKNQMTNAPDGACSYDANGNLTVAAGGKQALSYDAENRLAVVTNIVGGVPTTKTDFVYDGMSRLRKRVESSYSGPPSSPTRLGAGGGSGTWTVTSETHYLYDGMRVIQERDGNNAPAVSYTRGRDLSAPLPGGAGGGLEGAGGIGGLLARSHGYNAGNWSTHNSYHADGNGNVTALVNSSGGLQASYRYDSYGNLLSSSGALAGANAYRFSSKEWMATASLYYYGYRFYSPNWQRWMNRDPIEEEDGINLYGFVGNSPLSFVDSWGLAKDAACVNQCYANLEACYSLEQIAEYFTGGALGLVITARGAVMGSGPHTTPTGKDKCLVNNKGQLSKYGKGLGKSIGGGLLAGAGTGMLALHANVSVHLLVVSLALRRSLTHLIVLFRHLHQAGHPQIVTRMRRLPGSDSNDEQS